MVDTLVARQRKIGAYWFRQVSPLDRFAVDSLTGGDASRLCFDDLALVYGLEQPRGQRVRVDVYDDDGRLLHGATQRGFAHGCAVIPVASTNRGYTIVKLAVLRDATALPPVAVHLARDARGTVRIIGIRRE